MRALSRLTIGLLLGATLGGCHPGPTRGPLSVAAAQPPQPASLLRIPRRGGKAALFRFPALDPSAWVGREELPAVRRIIGANIDARLVYLLDPKGNVVAVDLESGKNQPVLSDVSAAAVGPDGTLYTAGNDRTLSELSDRTPVTFPGKLAGAAQSLFGSGDESVIAILEGRDPRLAVGGRQHPPVTTDIPAGEATATTWGNLVAIAADSAVVLFTPGATHPFRTLDAGRHVQHVAFSPSGHRLYVARGGADELTVYDRFTWSKQSGIDLPGEPGAMRSDPLGRYLLVRPAKGDSVWVMDLSTHELLGSWSTAWGEDLPAVAASRFLLLRQGQDLVGYDLATAKLPEIGRIPGGAADLWLVLGWAPRGEAPQGVAPDSTALVEGGPVTDARVFVQVSSSQNPAWADELARKLSGVGLPASVIKPQHPDEGYRVVLGPYPSREAAESTGKKLGQPYFIYTPDTPGH